jgi:hypothetical protein
VHLHSNHKKLSRYRRPKFESRPTTLPEPHNEPLPPPTPPFYLYCLFTCPLTCTVMQHVLQSVPCATSCCDCDDTDRSSSVRQSVTYQQIEQTVGRNQSGCSSKANSLLLLPPVYVMSSSSIVTTLTGLSRILTS